MSLQPKVIPTLLVAPDGAMKEALKAGLYSIPGVEIVDTVAGCLPAARLIPRLAPRLMVVSGQLPFEEIAALLVQTSDDGHCEMQIVVVAASPAQRRRLVEAGAATVVDAWGPIDALRGAVQGLRDETESSPLRTVAQE